MVAHNQNKVMAKSRDMSLLLSSSIKKCGRFSDYREVRNREKEMGKSFFVWRGGGVYNWIDNIGTTMHAMTISFKYV